MTSAPPRTIALTRAADVIYGALASLRAAVAILLALGVVCSAAIAYESMHGTAAVQRDVYRTTWFSALLTLLGLNILCSVTKRYPWKRHQIGFVLAHAGILFILIGSLVSLHFGADGTIRLSPGESSSRMELPERSLQVLVPGYAADVFPVAFERSLSRSPAYRFELPGGFTLVADDFVGAATVRVCIESPQGRTPSLWIRWTEVRTVSVGSVDVRIAFRPPELLMPFRITLLRARVGRYPGSALPSSYESWLQVDDEERGPSTHHVTMNHPLRLRGHTLFLASLADADLPSATFTVAASPGLPAVYAGTVLVMAGVACMFYLEPLLRRRGTPERRSLNCEREVCG